ncbi:hypothetical protein PCIT_a3415 [Pseudoalteromonas citrea]|uniref:Uncharacterized protein n=2 Tax=Pseudoalteromonas citrea TaxID=43655 RepID=A0AAD4AGX4_9GAMM|nr:hypothetical protein [Pseudoalteromonas citrea]KAF7768895.1 hypothetical protein PCIT_a3415 [Pseudoalteromonas citrea]
MFQEAQIKLKCWFHNLAQRPNYRRYANIDMDIDEALKNNTYSPHLLIIDDIKSERVTDQAVEDVSKYTLNARSVYVKHVFINELKDQIKPTISASDIDFFRALDQISMYCYVLVYVKNYQTKQYDSAFFLDDYEAIQGVGKAEAQSRITDLTSISKIIRTVLL